MAENSQDDKYKIPQDRVLNIRVNDKYEWVILEGHPKIKTLSDVIFNNKTGDIVQSLEVYNISSNTFQIRCQFPNIDGLVGDFYIGGYSYYTILSPNNTYVSYGPNGSSSTREYSSSDRYSQEYDGYEVRFKENGYTYYTELIDPSIKDERLWFGFDHPDSNIDNTIEITKIVMWTSGPKGDDGTNGDFISYGNGVPSSDFLTSGDDYINTGAAVLYPRKNGLCGSLFFDGLNANNTHLSIPNDVDFQLGTGEFTIEWFQYMKDDYYGRVFSIGDNYFAVSIENTAPNVAQTLYFWFNGVSHSLSFLNYIEHWAHIALVRLEGFFLFGSTNRVGLFVNGVYQSNIDFGYDITNIVDPLIIGNMATHTSGSVFRGYITNFRWTKGKGLYNYNFPVSKVPLTALPETKLLINAVNSENAFVDSSGNDKVITNNNNAVFWEPVTPFKTEGTWTGVSPIILNDISTILNLGNYNTLLWNFVRQGFTSVIIYLNCSATSNNTLIEMAQILLNNGTAGPSYTILGSLPAGVTLSTVVNSDESSLYVRSSLVNYNNTSYRVMVIV